MFLTREQVRSIDRRAIEEFGVPGVVLMENAGRGAAELLRSLMASRERKRPESLRITICCGKGNNGGDGFVMARHLDLARLPVRVLLFGRPEQLAGDAAVNYRILERSSISMRIVADESVDQAELQRELAAADWIVDALFGTGLRGPVRQPLDRVIAAINSCGARVFAVDIPSGLDCDTGAPLGPTVRAEQTATFVAQKIGFREPAAREWLGDVHVIDIGAPRVLVEELMAQELTVAE